MSESKVMNSLTQTKKINPIINYTILLNLVFGLFIFGTIFTSITTSILPAYFLILLIAGFFIFKHPEIGIYLILIQTMIFERIFTLQALFINDILIKAYPLDFIIFLTLLSLINRIGIKKLFKEFITDIKNNIISKMLIIWNALVTIYFLFSIFYLPEAIPALAFGIWKNYVFYTIIYFLLIHTIKNTDQIKRFLKIFLSTSVLILIFLLIGFINGQGLWVEINPLSTEGVRYLANSHALYLMPAIFLILSFLAFGKKLYSKYTLPILLIQIFAIIISLFRHLWLGLIFGMLFIFLNLKNNQKKVLIKLLGEIFLALFIFIIIFLLIANFSNLDSTNLSSLEGIKLRWSSLIHYKSYFDTSAMWRIAVWEKSIEIIKANPFFGIGLGREISIRFLDFEKMIPIRDVHNEWLGIVIQMGAIGLLAIISFIICLFTKITKYYRRSPNQTKPLILGIGTFLITYIFMANFNVYFNANLFLIIFWLFFGLFISLVNKESFYVPPKS